MSSATPEAIELASRPYHHQEDDLLEAIATCYMQGEYEFRTLRTLMRVVKQAARSKFKHIFGRSIGQKALNTYFVEPFYEDVTSILFRRYGKKSYNGIHFNVNNFQLLSKQLDCSGAAEIFASAHLNVNKSFDLLSLYENKDKKDQCSLLRVKHDLALGTLFYRGLCNLILDGEAQLAYRVSNLFLRGSCYHSIALGVRFGNTGSVHLLCGDCSTCIFTIFSENKVSMGIQYGELFLSLIVELIDRHTRMFVPYERMTDSFEHFIDISKTIDTLNRGWKIEDKFYDIIKAWSKEETAQYRDALSKIMRNSGK